LDEALEAYGGFSLEELAVFRYKVKSYLDFMSQDDAVGRPYVVVRENGDLMMKAVNLFSGAETIDLNNLQQYEMILFDTGCIYDGSMWKHLFFPKLLKDFLVNE